MPLAAFSGTADWAHTNYLSNITPQASALNQGPWNRLEAAVRRLVTDAIHEALYVMTGPLYRQSRAPLPNAAQAHLVPSDYWKVVAVQQGDRVMVAGFLLSQSASRQDAFCDHIVPRSAIEAASGLQFYHGLDAWPQMTVESGDSALLEQLGCTEG